MLMSATLHLVFHSLGPWHDPGEEAALAGGPAVRLAGPYDNILVYVSC